MDEATRRYTLGKKVVSCDLCPISKYHCEMYQDLLKCGQLCPLSVAIASAIGRE